MKIKILVLPLIISTILLDYFNILKLYQWYIYIGVITGAYTIYGILWTRKNNYKIYNDLPNTLRVFLIITGSVLIIKEKVLINFLIGATLIILGILLNDEWQRKKFRELTRKK